MEITCAILAGGKSERMGFDKATLELSGEMLLSRVIRKVHPLFKKTVIVAKSNNIPSFGLPVFIDLLPFQTPLSGILTALLYAETDYIFVFACDMPFLRREAIFYMIEEIGNEDIILPIVEKGFEPLHALYKRTCISYIMRNLSLGIFRIPDLFPYLSVKFIPPHPSFFFDGISVFTNINTKEDLEIAERAIRKTQL